MILTDCTRFTVLYHIKNGSKKIFIQYINHQFHHHIFVFLKRMGMITPSDKLNRKFFCFFVFFLFFFLLSYFPCPFCITVWSKAFSFSCIVRRPVSQSICFYLFVLFCSHLHRVLFVMSLAHYTFPCIDLVTKLNMFKF